MGESNPSFDHGEYSEFHEWALENVPEEHRQKLEALDLNKHGDELVETEVKRLLYLARITGDERFDRELRQWLKEFGPIEPNAEKHQLEHSGEIDGTRTVELDEGTKELARELIKRQQEEASADE